MSDDPAPRITAALETYISAKAIYGAALLETQAGESEEWRVRAVMPQANAYMETLAPVCEALEIGWPAVIARLAAAEAVVVAYKAIHGEYTTYLEKSSDYRHLRRTLEATVTAYDALAGTGEGARADGQ